MARTNLNREGWLTELARQAEPLFRGFKLPAYRVTCGWPSKNAMGRKGRRVGECHGPKSSKAGVFELFISPCLDEVSEVAGTLAHEIAHVCAGIDAGHGKRFKVVCAHVGLTKGKPTEVMPGERLAEQLKRLTDALGAYPHSAIVGVLKKVTEKPPSRVTLECECGCKITIASKWLTRAGPPICGCGKLFVSDAPEQEDSDNE